jgi:hypothetical protein
LFYGFHRHFQQYFSYIVVVSFIGHCDALEMQISKEVDLDRINQCNLVISLCLSVWLWTILSYLPMWNKKL